MKKGKGKQRMTFQIPYTKTKASFQNDIKAYTDKFESKTEVINQQDIAGLPAPVQKYFKVSGYLGKLKMTSMKAYITSAPLKDSFDKPPMMVDYTLCSFAEEPVRLAYIKTSIAGIPFEAYDSIQNGVGFMKGVIGTFITIFNQTGYEMDKGQLLTYLSECFFIPSSVFYDYITWESIDSTHARATITQGGVSGSGIFTFGEDGFVTSFYTDERAKVGTDGSISHPKWSLIYERFTEKGGVFYPAHVKTIWHENDGDFVYFDGDDIEIIFSGDI